MNSLSNKWKKLKSMPERENSIGQVQILKGAKSQIKRVKIKSLKPSKSIKRIKSLKPRA